MRAVAAAALCASLTLAGCVGPATTVAAYRGKALRAANDALSEAEAIRLTSRELLSGRIMANYAEVVFSSAEDSLSSIQGSFDSIQPPDHDLSDKQRDALDQALTDLTGAAANIRISARRNDHAQLSSTVGDLNQAIAGLNEFIKDAVANRPNTILSTWYLTNIFTGFEIWRGGVNLESTSFCAVVN